MKYNQLVAETSAENEKNKLYDLDLNESEIKYSNKSFKPSYELDKELDRMLITDKSAKIIRNSYCSSKCMCFCCSKMAYCKSINKTQYFDSNDETNGLFKFYKFKLNFRNIKLKFNRLVLKCGRVYSRKNMKRLNIITFIPLFLFAIYLFLIVLTHQRKAKNGETYDLMKDALLKQNISRHLITCSKLSINNLNYINYSFKKSSELKLSYIGAKVRYEINKLDYFKNFYLNASSLDDLAKLDLDFEQLGASNLNLFKFCLINLKNKFISKPFNSSFLSILDRKMLLQSELKHFNIYNDGSYLDEGGYHKPPYCLQDYLYFNYIQAILKNNDGNINTDLLLQKYALAKVNELIKTYYSDPDIDKFKSNVINATRPILNELINEDHGINLLSYFKSRSTMTVVVIPFLKRKNNLIELLLNLHTFLQRQYVHYLILVAEQANYNDPFNKGRLYNTAYRYIIDNYKNANCMVLHDVDLVPESDFNLYECDNYDLSPRHLSVNIRKDENNFDIDAYKVSPYELLVGGVLAIKPDIFKLINGFSMNYFLWGGEDDGLKFFILFIK